MPFPTPAYPFDPALIEAGLHDAPRRTPHVPFPAVDGTPLVLGGVLRSDSPFLDATPLEALPPVDGILIVPLTPIVSEPLDAAELEPPAPFDRAAVERARARAARPVERVEATVWSDDGVAEHVCDVTAWLAGATARELAALVRAAWTGDEAEEVAAALSDDDPEVADVLRHARRTDAGVVVEIDGTAAVAWLARHRPAVADALDDAADHPTDDAADED
ncbi:hypothetical protein tb265_16400 [Gemmatimonadetes bacterium T265]|nr:hypothetical protein tb265_16400 [Gemmatimonadetes bacterium T265]